MREGGIMKKSQFVIQQEGRTINNILLYSSFSTSMVEMEKTMFSDIFEKERYDLYPNEVEQLYEMGFLIDDDYDELKFLESIRKKTFITNSTKPSYYIICPTTACNARCYYCFEKGIVQKHMDHNIAEAVAKYIVANHDPDNLTIQWFGGEPLLKPDIISFISDYLNANGIKFTSKIITNGYLLNDEIISKAISQWNVQIVQITIDDIAEDYNKIKDYIYHEENPFEKVMRNIERCLKKNLHIRVRVNFNPIEYDKAVKTVEYLKKRFGVKNNFFVYLAPIDSKDIPSITNEFENKKHPLIALLDAEKDFCSFGNYDSKQKNISKYDSILNKYYLTPIPTSCYGGCEASLTIDSMGNIFVCHRLLGNDEYSSGNVFTGRKNNHIGQYYANPYLTEEECNHCELLPICQGGCKYRAFKYGRNHACTMVKGTVRQLVKRAAEEINEL